MCDYITTIIYQVRKIGGLGLMYIIAFIIL